LALDYLLVSHCVLPVFETIGSEVKAMEGFEVILKLYGVFLELHNVDNE